MEAAEKRCTEKHHGHVKIFDWNFLHYFLRLVANHRET